MKKCLMVVLAVIMNTMITLPIHAQESDQPVTQGEFAIYLVRALGLELQLPVDAREDDYVRILEEQGITPPGGYEISEPLTKKDMAFLMVHVTGLESRVINKMTTKGEAAAESATIKDMTGKVEFRKGLKGKFGTAEAGDTMNAEDAIKTGPESTAHLKIGKYSAAYIGPNSEVEIQELATKTDMKKQSVRLYLKKGEMVVNVNGEKNNVVFETSTDRIVAQVAGTIFKITASASETTVTGGTEGVETYPIDKTGKPLADPKPLAQGQSVSINGTGNPSYNTEPQERINPLLASAQQLEQYLEEPAEGGVTGGPTIFQARTDWANGNEEALMASLDMLADEGVVIEATGAADAANATITRTKITQFINDLLLTDVFNEYNVDTTPIGL